MPFEQMGPAEIGPEGLGDVNFRIRELPEKEIAEPHFTARANDEIGIGQIACVEVFADCLLGNFQMVEPAIAGGGFGQTSEKHLRFRCARCS